MSIGIHKRSLRRVLEGIPVGIRGRISGKIRKKKHYLEEPQRKINTGIPEGGPAGIPEEILQELREEPMMKFRMEVLEKFRMEFSK